jgi:sirohydrochlorin ferrochelatase
VTDLPVLVGAAHGTRNPAGTATTRALLDAVRAARPDLDVRECYVDVCEPRPVQVLAPLDRPAVLVPLLLSPGYHVGVDLPRAARGAPVPVAIAEPLGPAEALVDVLVHRLDEACAQAALRVEDLAEVVLAAAGTSRSAGTAAVEQVAARLADRLARPVRPGYASAARPPTACAVALARTRHPGRPVGMATYLLAPGLFSRRAERSGADVVAGPLAMPGSVPAPLVDLVLARYEAALAASGGLEAGESTTGSDTSGFGR